MHTLLIETLEKNSLGVQASGCLLHKVRITQRRAISSSDINQYLQNLTGKDFTAKDYRTWAGSALALAYLREAPWEDEAQAKREVVEVIRQVSSQLGNTPAVCRRCYVHPAVLSAYLAGSLRGQRKARARKGLRAEEAALVRFLEALEPQA
ncbi:DNA topoisomerase IB [Pseudomonas mangiferae]|uniref:DNA topoisomerase IB n=1 Tax=Pseudomonas mangiferae TaxID=2593654 RepID=A0A553GTQ0_9PSED|nr:DNA topoisomerase IB [Pseudomonas mangiferae]